MHILAKLSPVVIVLDQSPIVLVMGIHCQLASQQTVAPPSQTDKEKRGFRKLQIEVAEMYGPPSDCKGKVGG